MYLKKRDNLRWRAPFPILKCIPLQAYIFACTDLQDRLFETEAAAMSPFTKASGVVKGYSL